MDTTPMAPAREARRSQGATLPPFVPPLRTAAPSGSPGACHAGSWAPIRRSAAPNPCAVTGPRLRTSAIPRAPTAEDAAPLRPSLLRRLSSRRRRACTTVDANVHERIRGEAAARNRMHAREATILSTGRASPDGRGAHHPTIGDSRAAREPHERFPCRRSSPRGPGRPSSSARPGLHAQSDASARGAPPPSHQAHPTEMRRWRRRMGDARHRGPALLGGRGAPRAASLVAPRRARAHAHTRAPPWPQDDAEIASARQRRPPPQAETCGGVRPSCARRRTSPTGGGDGGAVRAPYRAPARDGTTDDAIADVRRPGDGARAGDDAKARVTAPGGRHGSTVAERRFRSIERRIARNRHASPSRRGGESSARRMADEPMAAPRARNDLRHVACQGGEKGWNRSRSAGRLRRLDPNDEGVRRQSCAQCTPPRGEHPIGGAPLDAG